MEPVDGLAFIGRNPGSTDNVYIATGDSGNGHDPRHDRGHAAHRPHRRRRIPWRALYAPDRRKTLRAADEFVQREPQRRASTTATGSRAGEVEALEAIAPRAKARCCGAACRRSRSTATSGGALHCIRRCARTSAASCTGTAPSELGLPVPRLALRRGATGTASTAPPIAAWRRLPRRHRWTPAYRKGRPSCACRDASA